MYLRAKISEFTIGSDMNFSSSLPSSCLAGSFPSSSKIEIDGKAAVAANSPCHILQLETGEQELFRRIARFLNNHDQANFSNVLAGSKPITATGGDPEKFQRREKLLELFEDRATKRRLERELKELKSKYSDLVWKNRLLNKLIPDRNQLLLLEKMRYPRDAPKLKALRVSVAKLQACLNITDKHGYRIAHLFKTLPGEVLACDELVLSKEKELSTFKDMLLVYSLVGSKRKFDSLPELDLSAKMNSVPINDYPDFITPSMMDAPVMRGSYITWGKSRPFIAVCMRHMVAVKDPETGKRMMKYEGEARVQTFFQRVSYKTGDWSDANGQGRFFYFCGYWLKNGVFNPENPQNHQVYKELRTVLQHGRLVVNPTGTGLVSLYCERKSKS